MVAVMDGADRGQRKRESAARRSRASSSAVQDIGPIPAVTDANWNRRLACISDPELFLRTYFGFAPFFSRPFSQDHLRVIDKAEHCIQYGGNFAYAMPRGHGKALAIDTAIPTPSGWTTMERLKVGDRVFDDQGRVCVVIFATEVQRDRDCYRVTFDDGESVIADADHLWTVKDRYSRAESLTLATREMAGRVVLSTKRGWTEHRYSIPISEPIVGTEREFPVNPYILGDWLGDGATATNRLTIGDDDLESIRCEVEIHESFDPVGYRKAGANCGTYRFGTGTLRTKSFPVLKKLGGKLCDVSLRVRLKWLGVLGNKHIPQQYLRASESQRMELLRGLMDTDGTIFKDHTAEYCTKLPQLRDDVMELLASLGFKRQFTIKAVGGRDYYRVTFSPTDGRRVFSLRRKSDRQVRKETRLSAARTITSIESCASVPVKCIQVDSPSHLYLCGRGMIPTHNTTLCRAFVIRAFLFGLRQFALFVGAADPHARRSLSTIKIMLERSPAIAEDFPEIVFPILALEGSSKRQLGQTCMGEPTNIHWGKDYIQLPTCPPQESIRFEQGGGYAALAMASGIMGSGITGTNVNGRRPDYLCLDDPQTRQSAKSDAQCAMREEILAAMITGITSPGVKLAAFMPCTVIRQGDMADRHLNHEFHPEWAIERCKLLKTMPKRMELWEANKAIRNNYDPYAGIEDMRRAATEATEHYIENQPAMDEGAEAGWSERFNDDEVSAVQNAMNLHADNRFAFFAEMQNEPLPANLGNVEELTRAEVATRLSNIPRGNVPHGASKLTAFVDVQGIGLLFWMVCAWKDDFTGWIIDYGTHPNQGRRYFTKASAPKLLPPGDHALHAGLKELGQRLLNQQWQTESGGMMLDLLLIDSGHQAELVYEVCRQLRAAAAGARILPSKGEGARASDRKGFTEGAKPQGERRGFAWKLPPVKEIRGIRLLRYEVNAWKSFIMDRIAVKEGGRGSLTFFGSDADAHLMFFDHVFSEYRDRVTSERTGKEIDEWHARPNQDNDLWDCLIGCAVAASVQGSLLDGVQESRPKPAQVLDYAELYKQAQAAK